MSVRLHGFPPHQALPGATTILICVSVLLLVASELLRRRGERLRGVTPA